jgi:hypothetical protein
MLIIDDATAAAGVREQNDTVPMIFTWGEMSASADRSPEFFARIPKIAPSTLKSGA